MEQFQCENKVWVSVKGKTLDKIIWICGWMYLVGCLGLFFMDGIESISFPFLIFIILTMIWSRTNRRRSGKYVESICILKVFWRQLIWEYPQINMGKGEVSVRYMIAEDCIEEILYSSQMQSIRILCRPQIEIKDVKGKETALDYQKEKKDCVLILYNEKTKDVVSCLEKYLNVEISQID